MGTCVHFSRSLPSNSWWQTTVGWHVLSRPSAAEGGGRRPAFTGLATSHTRPPRSTAGNINSAGCLKTGPQYNNCGNSLPVMVSVIPLGAVNFTSTKPVRKRSKLFFISVRKSARAAARAAGPKEGNGFVSKIGPGLGARRVGRARARCEPGRGAPAQRAPWRRA
jgi:hypothetical protein